MAATWPARDAAIEAADTLYEVSACRDADDIDLRVAERALARARLQFVRSSWDIERFGSLISPPVSAPPVFDAELATDLAFDLDEAAGILELVIPDLRSRESRERLTEMVAFVRRLAEEQAP